MTAFERDIPRFPDEPRPDSWPTGENTYFSPLMAAVAGPTAYFVSEQDHRRRKAILEAILQDPSMALGVQVHAHTTVKSIYEKLPHEQDLGRKKAYQTLIKRIGEARGHPVHDVNLEIDELIEREGFEGVTQIPGIEIVEDAKSHEGEDCFNYAFKSPETSFFDFWLKEQRKYRGSLPVEGAIVMYESDMAGGITHSGIVTGRNTVLSKWGVNSPVFEHPFTFVPTFYGEPVGCLRKIS